MRHTLLLTIVLGSVSMAHADDPNDRKSWTKQASGVWILTAIEADGVSTAGDKLRSDALKMVPTYLSLGQDGAYERKHANFAAVESDEGTFAVLTVKDGVVQVDVSARRTIRGDLPRPLDVKVSSRELWRLTDADTLERCLPSDMTKERPTKIGTAKGDGLLVLTYSRFKSPAGVRK